MSASNQSAQDILSPRIVVLMAVYNGVRWLPEQLNTILNQAGVHVTIFVSVDQSTDGSEQLIDEWAIRDSRIKVLPHGQRFGGAAPNFLRLLKEVDLSPFNFVSLADQDDIWDPNKLSAAIQLLESKKAEAYSSNAMAFWEGGRTAFINKSQAQVQWDYFFEAAGPGCTYVFAKSLALALQQLLIAKPNAGHQVGLHDWFIYAFARANGYAWVIDSRSWLSYRQHASNQVGMNSGFKAFMHRAKKVSSGWALSQSILLADLLDRRDDPFVKIWVSGNSWGLVRLAMHSWQCRRRLRDKFLFFCSCLYMALIGGVRS
jgi:rhamnosyltransferase